MFCSIDGSGGGVNGSAPAQQPFPSSNYVSNGSQTNFIATLLTDFVNENEFNYSFSNFGFDSSAQSHQHFDSSEASSPPPTPDIISSFAGFAPESPLSSTTTVETPTYADLCSPVYPIQSPTSSCSSLSTSLSISSPPMTYNETHRQLIKDSLRLTIQSRRVAQGLDLIDNNELSSNTTTESDTTSPDIRLSYADSERRRRRRERNKIAATKCRNKKKLHSIKLHQESESLTVNNAQMRKEIEDLKRECHQLIQLLSSHETNCKKTMNLTNNYNEFYTPFDEFNQIHSNNNNNNNISYTNNSYYSNVNTI